MAIDQIIVLVTIMQPSNSYYNNVIREVYLKKCCSLGLFWIRLGCIGFVWFVCVKKPLFKLVGLHCYLCCYYSIMCLWYCYLVILLYFCKILAIRDCRLRWIMNYKSFTLRLSEYIFCSYFALVKTVRCYTLNIYCNSNNQDHDIF